MDNPYITPRFYNRDRAWLDSSLTGSHVFVIFSYTHRGALVGISTSDNTDLAVGVNLIWGGIVARSGRAPRNAPVVYQAVPRAQPAMQDG